MNLFLTDDEVVELTGRHRKTMQIEQLRRMGIAFYVNGSGHPKVCRSAIEGSRRQEPIEKEWTSNGFKGI